MKCNAAVMWEQPGKWQVGEIELDPPRDGEVLVRMAAAGLCHSDDHVATNDAPMPHLPAVGGHEGAGVVEAVGAGVTRIRPGDHVVTTFIPSCGHCRWCATGQQVLCDSGAMIFTGKQLDGTFRMHANGTDVGQLGMVSAFSEYTVVPENSLVRIDENVPFTSACLLGCAVPTGWGSAVNVGAVAPGNVAIVIGTGGVGINAVQGCRHAHAGTVIAVDTDPKKHASAKAFGATHTTADLNEAADLARELTNGQGADVAIVTVSVLSGEVIGQAVDAIRKGGTVVVTSTGNVVGAGLIPANMGMFPMFHKRIQGSLYGGCQPQAAIPNFVTMYHNGQLMLDELVTKTYPLSAINEGYDDMHNGRNVRGVIDFTL